MFYSLPFRASDRNGPASDADSLPTAPRDRWPQAPKRYVSDRRVADRLSPGHLMMLR